MSSTLACNAALMALMRMTARPGLVVIVHVLDQTATLRRSATAMRAIRIDSGTELSSARMRMSRRAAPTRPQKRPAS